MGIQSCMYSKPTGGRQAQGGGRGGREGSVPLTGLHAGYLTVLCMHIDMGVVISTSLARPKFQLHTFSPAGVKSQAPSSMSFLLLQHVPPPPPPFPTGPHPRPHFSPHSLSPAPAFHKFTSAELCMYEAPGISSSCMKPKQEHDFSCGPALQGILEAQVRDTEVVLPLYEPSPQVRTAPATAATAATAATVVMLSCHHALCICRHG